MALKKLHSDISFGLQVKPEVSEIDLSDLKAQLLDQSITNAHLLLNCFGHNGELEIDATIVHDGVHMLLEKLKLLQNIDLDTK